jgi:hypothetical protein
MCVPQSSLYPRKLSRLTLSLRGAERRHTCGGHNRLMRKLIFLCLTLLLAAPAAALAGRGSPGDGTLSIKDGKGNVAMNARGGLIMRCGRCVVTVDDPVPGDGTGPVVFGEDLGATKQLTGTATLYRNTDRSDMRIRIIGGFFKVTVKGAGINVSLVGNGKVWLQADALADNPGTFAFDEDESQPLPFIRTKFQLGSSGNAGG